MTSLKKILKEQGYVAIELLPTKTLHLELKVSINGGSGEISVGYRGLPIRVWGLDSIDFFNLQTDFSEIKAAGAGASEMDTQISLKNTLEIGKWKRKNVSLVLFDLSHVNNALQRYDTQPIHGIIGADILKKGKAIIDYPKKTLFLK
ncbi:conserved hypothetical protein [Capnocytophaga canimorsus]|nr:acid protease [Capnocytophaga canimorsus]CEN45056.1 conserved hypothetical protein [Capnocytophaga canimorsus]